MNKFELRLAEDVEYDGHTYQRGHRIMGARTLQDAIQHREIWERDIRSITGRVIVADIYEHVDRHEGVHWTMTWQVVA